ncbi:ChaN family lipoprotein [Insolitispirillum peregrinum]|uniref:ChaN family lipoprotein n=1 Tax=Insolitispirillum peregrinum TaxID=80876 RepID=UPI00360FDB25
MSPALSTPVVRSCVLTALLLAGSLTVARAEDAPFPPAWQSTQARSHPLVGRILDTASHRWISLAELQHRLYLSRWVLLGEQHDNPDHHALQAALLAGLIRDGRRPAVAVEMIGPAQSEALAQVLSDASQSATPQGYTDALGQAVGWEQRQWPQWSWYRPIFHTALAARLEILPANLEREQLRAAGSDTSIPLPAPVLAAQTEAVVSGHCGLIAPGQALPMVRMQVARDQAMADALLTADRHSGHGGVLIAGAGHVRRDSAVPRLLPAGQSASVAMVEVQDDQTSIESLDTGDYDYLLFTPRADREDPCQALQQKLRNKG